MKQKYSFLIGLEKTVVRLLVIGVPIVMAVFPETWMNITLAGALNMLLNFAKNYPYSETNATI